MKKKELKKRIEDGFSELSPDLFEAVLEESRKQKVVWSEAETEKPSANGKFYMGRFPKYAVSLCASLAIIFLCIFSMLGDNEKSVFMVLDINPSIQVEMDESHQVKRLKGLNQDGKDVVKELKWEKGTVQELVDVLIQDVVEKSYLRENGGILVTLAARDKGVCENLERTLGEGIDRKLTELKVSGVTTAFQEVQRSSREKGRKRLETELKRSCGLNESQVQQMSVNELIQYCQDYTSLELKLSEGSEKERASGQKKEDKLPKPENTSQPEGSDKKLEESASGEGNRQEESGKNKNGTDGFGKKPSGKPDSEEQASQEDKKSEEGNTGNQKVEKPSGSAGAVGPAPTEEAVPSDTDGASMQPGGGEPLGSGSASGQPGSGSQSGTGGVLDSSQDTGQSGGGDESDQPAVVSPGQPGSSGQSETVTSGQPGSSDQPGVVTPGQSGSSGQSEKEIPGQAVSPDQPGKEAAIQPVKEEPGQSGSSHPPEKETPDLSERKTQPVQPERLDALESQESDFILDSL